MLQFHYIHHSAFTLSDGRTTLLFDPYLEGNPEGLEPSDIKADAILVSHYHGTIWALPMKSPKPMTPCSSPRRKSPMMQHPMACAPTPCTWAAPIPSPSEGYA
jgi:hypothetical protein